MSTKLLHGGMPELWPGSIITPNMAHTRYLDGCAQCEAQRKTLNVVGFDPATPHGFVYATSDKDYARYYASRAVKGWLYEVELDPDSIEQSTEDYFPSWRAKHAKVLKVLEKRVTLTMSERRDLFARWGGTEGEFERMVGELIGPYRRHTLREVNP